MSNKEEKSYDKAGQFPRKGVYLRESGIESRKLGFTLASSTQGVIPMQSQIRLLQVLAGCKNQASLPLRVIAVGIIQCVAVSSI